MRLVVDSTFLIDHLRGLPAATDRLAQIFEMGDDPIVTEVIVCEVRAGLRPENERDLAALLEPMEFVQPDPATATRAGRWRAEARARGWTLSLADALIAAAAASMDASVLTRNVRDLALTPVPVETY
ncbi:MAG TPA: PIN domain-containing protein [Candidatus Limnocylindrales bacterium]|nr:PIN domain-containing protein [Candidatus Limnocylindrales bacterium]